MQQFILSHLWSLLNSLALFVLTSYFIWLKIALSAKYDKKGRTHTIAFEKTHPIRAKIFKEISDYLNETVVVVDRLDLDVDNPDEQTCKTLRESKKKFRKFWYENQMYMPSDLLWQLDSFLMTVDGFLPEGRLSIEDWMDICDADSLEQAKKIKSDYESSNIDNMFCIKWDIMKYLNKYFVDGSLDSDWYKEGWLYKLYSGIKYRITQIYELICLIFSVLCKFKQI